MKVPYAVQGAFFAPALIGLIFILKATCPAGAGQGCFADPFLAPVFMPLTTIYKIFGSPSFIIVYEPVLIIFYWMIIGIFVGLLFDILRKQETN